MFARRKFNLPIFAPSAVRAGSLFPSGSILDHRGKSVRLARFRNRDPLPNYWIVLSEAGLLSGLTLIGSLVIVALLPLLIWRLCFSVLEQITPSRFPLPESFLLVLALASAIVIGLTGLFLPYAAIWFWSWRFGRRALARSMLKRGFCPACKYAIATVHPKTDGCTVCPECGAAWKLNAPNSERVSE